MTLIKIKNKKVVNLTVLFRLALKSIYDKKNLTFHEESELHQSIVNWQNHLALQLDLVKAQGFTGFVDGSIDSENQMALEIIGSFLFQDSEGKLDERKELFKRHNIDYRKFHRLPEAYKPEDFIKGKQTLEEHKRTNPEDYK